MYLSISEVQERWGVGENDLRRLILSRQLVPSYFFSAEVAKIVECFYSEDQDGTIIWIPKLMANELHVEDPGLSPYKLVWVYGFHFLVKPYQTGPLSCDFVILSQDRDYREETGGECLWYSSKTNPTISLDEVIKNGALMASEIKRFEHLQQRSNQGHQSTEGGGVALFSSKPNQRKEAVLTAIRELGHDPLKLPSRVHGKPWIKSKVKKMIERPGGLFVIGSTTFNKAWDELRAIGEIAEETRE